MPPSPSSPPDYDLIVIGAGLSGLTAATHAYTHLPASSRRILVLEAKDRVGGKTLSVPTLRGGVVDLGAAWINDTNQEKIYGVAKRFGVELVRQRAEGWDLHGGDGGEVKKVGFGENVFPPEDAEKLADFVTHIDSMGAELKDLSPAKRKELDNITLQKYCEKHFPHKAVLATANRGCRGWLGIEASETSTLFFIDYVHRGGGVAILSSDLKDGGQYLRVRKGTQTFSHHLASLLPAGTILLSHPVTSITQSPSSSTYTIHTLTTSTTFTAPRVILSIPSPLYRHITFTPALPPAKSHFLSTTTLGSYAKCILIYATPWWRAGAGNLALSGRLNATSGGPFAFTRDTSSDEDGQFSLTCFVVGEEGRKWAGLGREERRRRVVEQVGGFVDGLVDGEDGGKGKGKGREEPVQILEMEWVKERWSEGAPNPVPGLGGFVGVEEEEEEGGGVEAMKKPLGGLHFVGTETADVWRGYMDGAVRSGERGAEEVVRALSGDGGGEKGRAILQSGGFGR